MQKRTCPTQRQVRYLLYTVSLMAGQYLFVVISPVGREDALCQFKVHYAVPVDGYGDLCAAVFSLDDSAAYQRLG